MYPFQVQVDGGNHKNVHLRFIDSPIFLTVYISNFRWMDRTLINLDLNFINYLYGCNHKITNDISG
jgi:hypothetical protein